ncbi:hypothetical protein B6658_001725 [Campylobacter coli]
MYEDLEVSNLLEKADFPQDEPLLKILEILEHYELNVLLKNFAKTPIIKIKI